MRFVNGVRTRTGLMGIDYPTAAWLYRLVHNTLEYCQLDPNMEPVSRIHNVVLVDNLKWLGSIICYALC